MSVCQVSAPRDGSLHANFKFLRPRYKPSTERRVGASGDTEHVTMPDFDVTRGDIAKALNWMAHPDFCPSQ